MSETQKTSLIWFRNDLRVHDNTSITKAITNNQAAIAVYCFDPRHYEINTFGLKKTERFRAQFLIETIHDLKKSLQTLNIPLFIFIEKPENCIPKLIKKHQVNHIFLQKEWTEEENSVLNNLKKLLPENISITESHNQFLFHPNDIPFEIKQIPNVFTEFRKQCEKKSDIRPEVVTTITKTNQREFTNTTTIPTLNDLGLSSFKTHHNSAFPFNGGETEALKRLNNYFFETKKLGVYKKTRNGLLGKDFSSKFSPWLANGSLSARHIYHEVKRFEKEYFKNQSTYWMIFELIWRDYFKYVSMKHQNSIFKIDGILKKDYNWSKNQEKIDLWINGETAESFVNANMIELKKTGWISNRGRQNVASYFAKSMKLDWRIGAAYFETMLLDYDVHSNYGNWMYVSGVGNDHRDRKFNIKLQAERYDGSGKYQRLWLQNTLF